MNGATAPTAAPARVLRAWLAVALWIALVWSLSGDEFAAPATEGWLARWLRGLFSAVPREVVAALNFAVRKGAHAAEYAVLGLLAFRAARLGRVRTVARQAALALALAALVAVADETRQGFSRTRGGSAWDVALDASGAALAVAMASRWRATRWGARLFPGRDGIA